MADIPHSSHASDNTMLPKLSQRQLNLLFAVVKEYCENGSSISSRVLKEKYGFTISPATIRNEFARLRDMGYLYQPFTNSSSQPTEIAFKLFINQLISGLHATSKNQLELKKQIQKLQHQQLNMQKEIARLLSLETEAVSFSVNMSNETYVGIKNLLTGEHDEEELTDLVEFLENLDKHKTHLLAHSSLPTQKKSDIEAVFSSDTPIIPLGKGYAMVATKAKVNNEDTIFGIITQPHKLGREKTLQIMSAIAQILDEEHKQPSSPDEEDELL